MAQHIVNTLCVSIGERSVRGEGNRQATDFFSDQFRSLSWQLDEQPFDAMDRHGGGAQLVCDGTHYEVQVGPYSLGCDVTAELATVQTLEELEGAEISGRAVLLSG